MGYSNQLTSYRKEYKSYRDSLKSAELDKDKRDYLLELKKSELAKKYNKGLQQRASEEIADRNLIPLHETGTEQTELQKYNDLAAGLSQDQLPSDVNSHGLQGLKDGVCQVR